jgi:hypothetical protein
MAAVPAILDRVRDGVRKNVISFVTPLTVMFHALFYYLICSAFHVKMNSGRCKGWSSKETV